MDYNDLVDYAKCMEDEKKVQAAAGGLWGLTEKQLKQAFLTGFWSDFGADGTLGVTKRRRTLDLRWSVASESAGKQEVAP